MSEIDGTPQTAAADGRRCARHSPRPQRAVNIIYTDLFLDAFNYARDWQHLWHDLLDMEEGARTPHRRAALVVLSQQIYDATLRNENATVLRDGRCFITTPTAFDRIGDADNPPPALFDSLVYFNTDPFALSVPTTGPTAAAATIPSLAGSSVVKTPFACTFDRYMSADPDANAKPIAVVFNAFLMRTAAVSEYEQSSGVRVRFTQHVMPVHSYERDVLCATVSNYCSDVVLSAVNNMELYTVRPEQQIANLLRALGPVVAESLLQPDRLVQLDLSEDRGGRSAASEYYRMKQFYYTFAHGKRNKWGVKLAVAAAATLRSHLRRWNALLREEMRRWLWVATHGSDTLPPDERLTENQLREMVLEFYTACPCILNAINVDRDVLYYKSPPLPPPTTDSHYVRRVLKTRYDTSTLPPAGDLNDRAVVDSLLAGDVAVSNELLTSNTWQPLFTTLQIHHDRFFTSMLTT